MWPQPELKSHGALPSHVGDKLFPLPGSGLRSTGAFALSLTSLEINEASSERKVLPFFVFHFYLTIYIYM